MRIIIALIITACCAWGASADVRCHKHLSARPDGVHVVRHCVHVPDHLPRYGAPMPRERPVVTPPGTYNWVLSDVIHRCVEDWEQFRRERGYR